MSVDLAITLLLSLMSHASEISSLIAKARAEGRDTLSKDEWDQILNSADASEAVLAEAIERAKQEGR